ncbi:alpha-L-fucosidase [Candidatus Nomurabacteria bacterium]|nr:alpha-L-fucosidase [Candidatus Nomurabacteria bacterium]
MGAKLRTEWFTNDRFGMFIHWGIYSVLAHGEWARFYEKISNNDYEKYFNTFDPIDYDPRSWARAAKNAGMKYAVMTAKHHDGFCLFDSVLTDYKATNTKAGRDLIKDYVEAFRAEGLKVGLYYSLIDWHHPDYPHYGHRLHPMRDNEDYKGLNHDFDRYIGYMHGQVEELCRNYGKIDLMWFDFSYDDMEGSKWQAEKLVKMVRSYQPDVVIDNRLEVHLQQNTSLVSGDPLIYSGDFISPEQVMPPQGFKNAKGEKIPWEECLTMNDHWGFCYGDDNFKPASMLVKVLTECVSKDGNLLVNVGPDARGNIPEESVRILNGIGRWMEKNSESIYGCGSADMPKPENGRITRKDNVYYYHVYERPVGTLPLFGFSPKDIKSVRLLSSGNELQLQKGWPATDFPDIAFVHTDKYIADPEKGNNTLAIEMK